MGKQDVVDYHRAIGCYALVAIDTDLDRGQALEYVLQSNSILHPRRLGKLLEFDLISVKAGRAEVERRLGKAKPKLDAIVMANQFDAHGWDAGRRWRSLGVNLQRYELIAREILSDLLPV